MIRPTVELRKEMAITKIFASLNTIIYPIFKPNPVASSVLQIFDMYEVRDENTRREQFRMVLSDGYNLQHAVLAPELHEKMKSTLIKSGSIIRIFKYTLHASVHHELKRLIKILDMEVLASNFSLIRQALGLSPSYFTLPWEEGMAWNEQDWELEDNWEWLDPEDPDRHWEEDE